MRKGFSGTVRMLRRLGLHEVHRHRPADGPQVIYRCHMSHLSCANNQLYLP
jgi:hypothetical protein